MAFDTNNPYFRTKVMTASPEQLRMLLIEGAIQFMRQGREGLAAKNYERSYEGLTQAKAILMELINALKPEVAPELCARLQGLYVYMYRLLTEGSFEKNLKKIDEAIELMEYERETWALLLEKLADRKKGPDETASAAAEGKPAPRPGASISLSA